MSEQASYKREILQQVAKGAGIIFLGTLINYALRFIYRLVVSRMFGPADYGLLSLAEAVLEFASWLAVIGLSAGVVRYVSHHATLQDHGRVKGTFLAAFKITGLLSLAITLSVFFLAKPIGITLFKSPQLVPLLQIFAAIIPFSALLMIISQTLLAFKRPLYSTASTIARSTTLVLMVGAAVLAGGNIFHVALAHLAAFVAAFGIAIYLLEAKVFAFFRTPVRGIYSYKELLFFSLPLFFSGVFINIMKWADTFFLGTLKTAADVGIYNVALPLAASLAVFLSAFANIFYPIMSELRAQHKLEQLGETYAVVIRWLFLATLPLVAVVVLFPDQILGMLFGASYKAGSSVLVILTLANFISVITGPCSQLLMTFNKTRFIFYVNSAMAALNVVLNILLIPQYGIVGAAVATAISIVLRELLLFFKARNVLHFGYDLRYYGKYVLSMLIPLVSIYFLLKISLDRYPYVLLACAGAALFIGYGVLLLLLRSFSKEDVMVMAAVERRLGLDLKFIKRLVGRFLPKQDV